MSAQGPLRLVSFREKISLELPGLRREAVATLQVNLGRRCNQACRHCHVDASPARAETMERRTAQAVLRVLERNPGVRTLDITGGAPELCAQFRYLAAGARALGREVIDRCNLTVLFEPGQEDLAKFLGEHRVRVIASLPCYGPVNVDKQRGAGVFEKSIAALRILNGLGYGDADGGLELDLVYNPLGPALPPDQTKLETEYRTRLLKDHGVRFGRLLTIANQPIARFKEDLERSGALESYMSLLADSFNPAAAEGLMCRSLISVRWDGRLSDCDFNQMLDLPVPGEAKTIWDVDDLGEFNRRSVAFGDHCYACTAGRGSSCGGAIVGARA